jgi:hypothetical protein
MKSPHTEFNQTRMVETEVYMNAAKIDSDKWEDTIWIERDEDWYMFESKQYRDKLVRVVTRENWLKSKQITGL